MIAPRLILSLRWSDCCGSKMILVRSRDGGFVSQNCLKCGKESYHLHEKDIPDLDCAGCKGTPAGSVIIEIVNKNYVYKCERCRRQWVLAEILPHWQDLFPYCGLGAPGDASFSS